MDPIRPPADHTAAESSTFGDDHRPVPNLLAFWTRKEVERAAAVAAATAAATAHAQQNAPMFVFREEPRNESRNKPRKEPSNESDEASDESRGESRDESHDEPRDEQAEEPPATSPRRCIEDCIADMKALGVNQMAYGPQEGDDTAIFIRPPPREPGQSPQFYNAIVDRYNQPMFGKSAVFRECAPDFYKTNFDPMRQRRLRARLAKSLAAIEHLQMAFVLDMTPPHEGEEAVQGVVELTCPEGIMNWSLSLLRFGCHVELVRGQNKLEGTLSTQPYSQIRHNSAIERLILAIHGHDPGFDSAIKVYTTAMLAKQIGVVGGRLQDWVVPWVRAPNNIPFVEILPEATLQMAESLQSPMLAMTSFSVLLGERLLHKDTAFAHPAETSLHGRMTYPRDISEAWESRIQYALQSYEARVEDAFRFLTDKRMAWVENIPEFQMLSNGKAVAVLYQCLPELTALMTGLKEFVRACIMQCLCKGLLCVPMTGFLHDLHQSGGESLHRPIDYIQVWEQLRAEKRKHTRLFWSMLASMRLSHLIQGSMTPADVEFTQDFQLAQTSGCDTSALKASGVDTKMRLDRLDAYYRMMHGALLSNEPFPSSSSPKRQRDSPTTFRWIDPWKAEDLPRRLNDTEAAVAAATGITLPFRELPPPYSAVAPAKRPSSYTSTEVEQIAITGLTQFRFETFFEQVGWELSYHSRKMLAVPPGLDFETSELTFSNLLLCLGEEELRYLPLWAGGNDDGTGGVFNNEVPPATDGFATHGPSIRQVSDSQPPSVYSFAGDSEVPSSYVVNDGYSDTLERRRVYAMSEVESEASWTDVLAHRNVRTQTAAAATADDVVSLSSENTATEMALPDLIEEEAEQEETAEQEKTAARLNDYSDIFMDSDDEDEDDADFFDVGDYDEMEAEAEVVVELPATAATASHMADEEDQTVLKYRRNIDEELLYRP